MQRSSKHYDSVDFLKIGHVHSLLFSPCSSSVFLLDNTKRQHVDSFEQYFLYSKLVSDASLRERTVLQHIGFFTLDRHLNMTDSCCVSSSINCLLLLLGITGNPFGQKQEYTAISACSSCHPSTTPIPLLQMCFVISQNISQQPPEYDKGKKTPRI